MASTSTLLKSTAVLLIAECIRKLLQILAKRSTPEPPLPLPPGPVPLPFIGNLLDLNKDTPFLSATAWSKKYGDIVYIRVMHKELVILNSEELATELLEKRSKNYSDRPVFLAVREFGLEWMTIYAHYGPRLRLHRRLFHQFFHAQAELVHRSMHLQKAYELAICLLDDPAGYTAHFITFTAAVVMEVAYGYNARGNDSETFVRSMQRATEIGFHATRIEVLALYDAFPFIKALPAWFPGMGGLKAKAAECRRLGIEGVNAPYEWVQKQVCKREGIAVPSMVTDAIIQHRLVDDSKDPELVQALKDSAGTLYGGDPFTNVPPGAQLMTLPAAVETTNGTLRVFVYLMMNHPDIQQRAQAEIDRVVGRQRLPDFEDRVLLPYVDAVIRETIRWHPVIPTGGPRAATEGDVCRGYFIPKGAIIVVNTWGISRNEIKYPNPDKFMPERFFHADGTLNDDKLSWIFGFGRRICPGRHVAESALWSAVVHILALFTIEKTEGSDNVRWETGLASHPHPFPCKIVPRDKEMDDKKLAALLNASRMNL